MREANASQEPEKREYFRIDDKVILEYRQVSEREVTDTEKGLEANDFSWMTMMAQFDTMSRELGAITRVIGKSSSNISQCLEMLDSKINMIGQQLVAGEMEGMGVEPQSVNLGAGGASFKSTGPVMVGGMLEVRMMLLPEHTGIISYAKVVNCSALEEAEEKRYRYRVSIEFVDMQEDVRDRITRHVLSRERDRMIREKDSE